MKEQRDRDDLTIHLVLRPIQTAIAAIKPLKRCIVVGFDGLRNLKRCIVEGSRRDHLAAVLDSMSALSQPSHALQHHPHHPRIQLLHPRPRLQPLVMSRGKRHALGPAHLLSAHCRCLQHRRDLRVILFGCDILGGLSRVAPQLHTSPSVEQQLHDPHADLKDLKS